MTEFVHKASKCKKYFLEAIIGILQKLLLLNKNKKTNVQESKKYNYASIINGTNNLKIKFSPKISKLSISTSEVVFIHLAIQRRYDEKLKIW